MEETVSYKHIQKYRLNQNFIENIFEKELNGGMEDTRELKEDISRVEVSTMHVMRKM